MSRVRAPGVHFQAGGFDDAVLFTDPVHVAAGSSAAKAMEANERATIKAKTRETRTLLRQARDEAAVLPRWTVVFIDPDVLKPR